MTGLSNGAYQGEVILPSTETLKDGAFPENLSITLPAAYGQNATMKLKLLDPENGIYESSAKDRNFQIAADENGNITIKSVNVEELTETAGPARRPAKVPVLATLRITKPNN